MAKKKAQKTGSISVGVRPKTKADGNKTASLKVGKRKYV